MTTLVFDVCATKNPSSQQTVTLLSCLHCEIVKTDGNNKTTKVLRHIFNEEACHDFDRLKLDTTTVASDATFSETIGESVESVELERVSASNQLGADKPMGGSVRTVRTVYARPSRTVVNSYYSGNGRYNDDWSQKERKRNSRYSSFSVYQNGGSADNGCRRQENFGTRPRETSSGFTGEDSCPAALSAGTIACGARERDRCSDAGNGSKPDKGRVRSLGTRGMASGLLEDTQPRRSTGFDRSPP